jgi:hypothetical protein
VDFDHVVEEGCFARQVAVELHKAIFYLLHVIVGFTLHFDLERGRYSLVIVTILDVLMVFIGYGVACNIANQGVSRKVELGITCMFPDKECACGVERVCDAGAVDEDSHASVCVERFDWAMFNDVAGERGQTVIDRILSTSWKGFMFYSLYLSSWDSHVSLSIYILLFRSG